MKFTWYKIVVIGTVLSLVIPVHGQDKKEIREKGISSKTVEEYFIEEGMDKPVIESIEKYNKDGELVEIQLFSSRGEVKTWEKYVYDDKGWLVEEIFLDEKGNIMRTEKSIYENGLKVEKQFFNERDKLYKKKKYVYDYR
ncbi:MAG: hypothetical protein V2B15_05090 [Bacteroidota bacterium]